MMLSFLEKSVIISTKNFFQKEEFWAAVQKSHLLHDWVSALSDLYDFLTLCVPLEDHSNVTCLVLTLLTPWLDAEFNLCAATSYL